MTTDFDPYSDGWRDAREERLETDNRECQIQGEWCSDAVEVHHIVKARTIPDPDERHDQDNLITLCLDCHAWLETLDPTQQMEILQAENPAEHAPDGIGRFIESDRGILELLQIDRETTGSIARQLDKHPQTIRDRLKWLREWGLVRYHHEATALHELVPQEGA